MRKMVMSRLVMLLFFLTTSTVFAFPYPNADINKGRLTVGSGVVFNFMGLKDVYASDNYIEYGLTEKLGALVSYDDAQPFGYDDSAIAGALIYQLSEKYDLVERGKKYSAQAIRIGYIKTHPTDVEAWALSTLRNYEFTKKVRCNFGLGFGYPTAGNVPRQPLLLADVGVQYEIIENLYLELSTMIILGLETKDRRGEALPVSVRLTFRF